jgi:hypothetical protein
MPGLIGAAKGDWRYGQLRGDPQRNARHREDLQSRSQYSFGTARRAGGVRTCGSLRTGFGICERGHDGGLVSPSIGSPRRGAALAWTIHT